MKNIRKILITLCLYSTLFACSSESDSDKPNVVEEVEQDTTETETETEPEPEPEPEPPLESDEFLVSGKAYGLHNQTLSLTINSSELIEINNSGNFSFSTVFKAEQQAEVTISQQPEDMNCQLFNSTATILNEADVIVQCLAILPSCDKTTVASTNPLDLSGNNIEGIETIVADVECGQQQWRIDAKQRIEEHRKTSGKITLVDKNGDLVINAKVHLELQQHDFKFGGIVQAKMWDGAVGNISDLYRQTYLGFNFNKAGLQNGLKYKLRKNNQTITERILPWLNSYDIPVRGHALIWPGWGNMEESISVNDANRMGISAGAPRELSPTELKIYVDTIIKDWAAKWDVEEWDVANEIRGKQDVQNTYCDSRKGAIPLCEQEEANWFKLAKQHVKNPSATLYLNENRVISDTAIATAPEIATDKMKIFESDMLSILDNDGPLEALGFQSRFGKLANGELLDAETMYQRLSYFDKYQLPIAATEFEMKAEHITTEFERALMTERVMSVYFSKENVTDILVWTFFDKNDGENKYIVELDGSPNLRGKTWLYMVKKHWHTDVLSWFNRDGELDFTGFKGKYLATISVEGFPDENVEFEWVNGSSGITLRLPNYTE
ncbi:endo-1,4-beta-xylanase [Thalassotalea fonticola]|uniref:Endo-1,4-beta-xylanase n=1 Tax=Thalassotalea fonticola TaxID=3065649 RepID=A0ABZ0GVY1_9GAMM|nr:endo-1,4-beta-xylanase [Colwelliaceae bacterium S1-1]